MILNINKCHYNFSLTKVKRRLRLVQQELFILPEYLIHHISFNSVRIAQTSSDV